MVACFSVNLSRARIRCYKKAQQGFLYHSDRQQVWNSYFHSIHTLSFIVWCFVYYPWQAAWVHVYFTVYADTFGLNLAAALSKALLFSSRSTKRGCCGATAFKELSGVDVSHNAHVIFISEIREHFKERITRTQLARWAPCQ